MTLDMLKKLNDIDYVVEVMGDYTGGASRLDRVMIKETGNELETGRSKSSDIRTFMIGI